MKGDGWLVVFHMVGRLPSPNFFANWIFNLLKPYHHAALPVITWVRSIVER